MLVAAIILWNRRYHERPLADIRTPGGVASHIALTATIAGLEVTGPD